MGIVAIVLFIGWMALGELSNWTLLSNPLYMIVAFGVLLLLLFGAGFFIAYLDDIRYKRNKKWSLPPRDDTEEGGE